MRWVVIGGLYLVLTACTFGTTGDLGQADFFYECYQPEATQSDPYCDYDFDFGTGSLCAGFCAENPWTLNQGIPGPIALGAEFDLRVSDVGGSVIFSASPEMLEWTGDRFIARQEGRVAVLTKRSFGQVYDFTHLQIQAPDRIRFDRVAPDAPSVTNVTSLALSTGEVGWIRALPVHGNAVLYGALRCQWSEDATAILITSAPGDNLIEVTGDASGTGTLHLSLGALEARLPVTVVGDASSLSGGAP